MYMIRLKDLLLNKKLIEQSLTANVGEIGYLWPFADTDKEASSWENTRLANLFKGSLKGYFTYTGELDSIMNGSDIESSDLPRAGVADEDLHKNEFDNVKTPKS